MSRLPKTSRRLSEDTKKKMSLTRKGIDLPSYILDNLKPFQKGHIVTEDIGAKISQSLKGRSVRTSGWNHSEESKKLMSEKRKGIKISPEAIAKTAATNKGRKYPEQSVRMMGNQLAKALKGRKQDPEFAKRRLEGTAKFFEKWNRPYTKLEKQLYSMLIETGYSFIPQKCFGTRIVDAYLPDLNMVFEADGSYWHKDEEKKMIRDNYLISKGVCSIIHLDEHDLRSVNLMEV